VRGLQSDCQRPAENLGIRKMVPGRGG